MAGSDGERNGVDICEKVAVAGRQVLDVFAGSRANIQDQLIAAAGAGPEMGVT